MAQEGAGVAPRVSTAGPRKGWCPLFCILIFFWYATPEYQTEVDLRTGEWSWAKRGIMKARARSSARVCTGRANATNAEKRDGTGVSYGPKIAHMTLGISLHTGFSFEVNLDQNCGQDNDN